MIAGRGLVLEGVSHRYPGADADSVTGVGLSVPPGSMLAVVGPSGSGKSTVLRLVAGLEVPREGRVLLGSDDLTDLPPERRGVGVVGQRPHLFEHLDVTGNIAFGPRVAGTSRREARARAAELLDLVHLRGLGHRRPGQLSGGQQQRVALARALATRQRVLLLDEPFGSLDPELRASMHQLLGEVREALAPTVLLVTHDLDEAGLAERVGVLVDGQLHQVASPAELYRRPASLTVARLLGGFVEVPGEVVASGAEREHRSAWGTWSLPTDCPARGPAVLLLRREELELLPPDAPAGTTSGVGAAPGEGTASLAGRVRGARRSGAREVAIVDAGALGTVEVELPLHRPCPTGEPVRVAPRAGAAAWAV